MGQIRLSRLHVRSVRHVPHADGSRVRCSPGQKRCDIFLYPASIWRDPRRDRTACVPGENCADECPVKTGDWVCLGRGVLALDAAGVVEPDQSTLAGRRAEVDISTASFQQSNLMLR